MAENIKNINKQIASFVLLSASLAIPAVSSAESVANNLIIADASLMITPNQYEAQSLPVFYASPSLPTVGPVNVVQPKVFYGAPSTPDVNPQVINVAPVAFYASPSIIQGPTINAQPPMAFYAAPSIPVNVVEPSVVPTPQNIKNSNPENINAVPSGYDVVPNANMKTEGFIRSEYGDVKIVEPYQHFIFK